MKLEILVKWRIGERGKFLQTFFIEYRKRFDLKWNIVPADSKTSLIIGGLQIDTIYFVRMFSRSILGESNKTEEVIVKTGDIHFLKHLSINHFQEERLSFIYISFYLTVVNVITLVDL